MSPKMTTHCSHIRLEEEQKALRTLAGMVPVGVTTRSAVQNSDIVQQVTEDIGGADETRTRDLLRDRQLHKIYLVGPSSFVLRHSTRFWT
jgi:hypothetical protein